MGVGKVGTLCVVEGPGLWLPVEPRLRFPVRDQPAVKCVFSPSVTCCLRASPVRSCCPLCLGWQAPCSETWPCFCWPQCSLALAFAWLWYQIVGIPDEIPCPACQRRCCDCHPHPHKCPLPEPVLVLTLRLSSKVPFLDPECGGS